MAKYIAKRVALALVTLVIVSMLTFFLMFLVPGGPFLSEKSPSPAVLAAMAFQGFARAFASGSLDALVVEEFLYYSRAHILRVQVLLLKRIIQLPS